eukprot:scaffold302011_cov17-Tisochrysis_lutea.AAC.1
MRRQALLGQTVRSMCGWDSQGWVGKEEREERKKSRGRASVREGNYLGDGGVFVKNRRKLGREETWSIEGKGRKRRPRKTAVSRTAEG